MALTITGYELDKADMPYCCICIGNRIICKDDSCDAKNCVFRYKKKKEKEEFKSW